MRYTLKLPSLSLYNLLFLLVFLISCGARVSQEEVWEQKAAEAERAGEFELAFDCYAQLASLERSLALKSSAWRHQAEIRARQGRIIESLQLYEKIQQFGDSAHAAQAAFVLAQTCDDLRSYLIKYCDEPASEGLLNRLSRECSDASELESFGRLSGRCRSDALWLAAQKREEKGEKQLMEEDLRTIASRSSSDPFWDDALWKLAKLSVEKKDYLQAVTDAMKLVDALGDVDWPPIGSERSVWADDALFLAACVYWADLDDPSKASRLFRRLVSEMPSSVWADDALWYWSHIESEVFEKLKKAYPDSRYLLQAGEETASFSKDSCHLWRL